MKRFKKWKQFIKEHHKKSIKANHTSIISAHITSNDLISKDLQQVKKIKANLIENNWARDRTSISEKKKYEMTHEHMQRCSISLEIREIQIKVTSRYHFTPTRLAKLIY